MRISDCSSDVCSSELEARAERFTLECDPAQFLSGQIAPGLWIVAPVFPIGIGKLREQYVAAADMPLDGLQSFGGFQYAVIDIEDRHILCFDQHPAIIEGHCAACYMHAAIQTDTFRLLQFHCLEALLAAEIKDATKIGRAHV